MLHDVMAAATEPLSGDVSIAVNFAMKMNNILDQLTNSLKVTQATQVEESNKKRQPQPGDCIILNMRNLLLGYTNSTEYVPNGKNDVNGVNTDGQGARLSPVLWQKYMGLSLCKCSMEKSLLN
jgi:hypothetical protein